jgi:hypothetical protein
MKKLTLLFWGFFLFPIGSFASVLQFVDNETVYLVQETSTTTRYFSKLSENSLEKVWFSVTYKKGRRGNDRFEFVVHGFSFRKEEEEWMDTQTSSCSKNAQKLFSLLQKHFVDHPIYVQILSNSRCKVEQKVFTALGDEREKEEKILFYPMFIAPEFYESLAKHFLSLQGKELQPGTVIDCPLDEDIKEKLEGIEKPAEVLANTAMYIITHTDPSTIEAIYRADFCLKENPFIVLSAAAKGTNKWDAANSLRQFRHFEDVRSVSFLGVPMSEIKVISELFPYSPEREK